MAKAPRVRKSNPLLDKIRENTTSNLTTTLDQSILFNEETPIPTMIPAMNIALAGSLDGGLIAGNTVIAGKSKHFKTGIMLLLLKSFLDADPDAVGLLYFSEFGSPKSYFEGWDIDLTRVMITPVTNIEMLKQDIVKQLNGFKRGDKVFIGTDSIGNLASLKEVTDAEDGKTTTDMTRAKAFKSLFRIITPQLALLGIPAIWINHTYMTLEMYAKEVVSGGTGAYLSADNIIVIGRQQDAEGKGKDQVINGYDFILKIEKSRYVKEKSTIILRVRYDTGVSKWSGLLDLAVESGHVVKAKDGSSYVYSASHTEALKELQTDTEAFWSPILADPGFKKFVEDKYRLGQVKMIAADVVDEPDAA